MQMVAESYDLLISSSPNDTSLARAMVSALSSRGFDAWSSGSEKRTKSAAERLQNAIDSTEVFLFVITPETQFSSQMYFELGAAMGKTMSGQPSRVIFVLVNGPDWELIPRFLRGFDVIDLEADSHQKIAERLVESLVRAGSSAA